MLQKISLTYKIFLLGLVMCVPIALLTNLYVQQSKKDILFAEQELQGVAYARSAWPGLTTLASAQSTPVDIAKLKQADANYLKPILDQDAIAQIQASDTPQAIAGIRSLISKIGDTSNLILDPDLDSFYAMDLAIVRLPELAQAVYEVRIAAEPLISRKADLEAIAAFQVAKGRLKVALDSVIASREAAYNGSQDGSLKAAFAPDFNAFEQKTNSFLDVLSKAGLQSARNEDVSLTAQEIDSLTQEILFLADKAWQKSADQLERLLKARIDKFTSALTNNLSYAFIALVFAAIIGLIIGRSMLKAISDLVTRMDKLRDGDTQSPIPYTQVNTEIGTIAKALVVFCQSAAEQEALRQALNAQQEAAKAELEATVARVQAELIKLNDARHAEHISQAQATQKSLLLATAQELEDQVGKIVENLTVSAQQLTGAASHLEELASKTRTQASSAIAAAQLAQNNMEEVAPSAQKLAASIAEIAGQVAMSSSVAQQACETASSASEQMNGLNNAVDQISTIVAIIEEIAEQTNLLSLNATIEAARAGEAGKGFAVVASEVKNLASQTAKLTSQISSQVTDIQTATAQAVAGIEKVTHSVDKVGHIQTSIAAAVEEQSAATAEISRSVTNASENTRAISSGVAGVDGVAVEAQASASQVFSAAREIARRADSLSSVLQQFLHTLRQAA
jgi:methyl-accepting chemotaxis protein